MATTLPSLKACSFVSLLQVHTKFFLPVKTFPSWSRRSSPSRTMADHRVRHGRTFSFRSRLHDDARRQSFKAQGRQWKHINKGHTQRRAKFRGPRRSKTAQCVNVWVQAANFCEPKSCQQIKVYCNQKNCGMSAFGGKADIVKPTSDVRL